MKKKARSKPTKHKPGHIHLGLRTMNKLRFILARAVIEDNDSQAYNLLRDIWPEQARTLDRDLYEMRAEAWAEGLLTPKLLTYPEAA